MASALWLRRPRNVQAFAEENTTNGAALRELAARYGALTPPIVIVTGTGDRLVPPGGQSYRLRHTLPAARLVRIEGAGHELMHTHRDAVLDAVAHCLDAAERSAAPAPHEAERLPARLSPAERARELVFRHGWNATAYQILSPEMEHWFSSDGDAVVGYVRHSGVRVAAGAPICAEARLTRVAAEFEASSSEAGDRVCYFGAADRLISAFADRPGYSVLVLGSQPVWDPARWPDILKRNASLRAQLNRARNKGVVAEEWSVDRASGNPDLQRCLDEWLASRPLPPMHFLTEAVALDRLNDRRVFVAGSGGRPAAFLLATPVPYRNGWLVEQIARSDSAPNGTAELLVDAAMRAFTADGADYVTMGLAPLSKRGPAGPHAPMPWLRLMLAWLKAHGRRFYNFEGLDAFKAKLRPDYWEPVYAISRERRFSVRTLYAIAAAFSDGPPAIAAARAGITALKQEIAWIARCATRRAADRMGASRSAKR
jgi:phosphatidylglycerol lysyltransferase